jgi:pyruvate carboxylase
VPLRSLAASPAPAPADLLDEKGPKVSADWMRGAEAVLLTDTTMRDGHQSLLATRMRSIDMIRIAGLCAALPQLFSLECWGGATFDVAMRFLNEGPVGAPARWCARHARTSCCRCCCAALERRRLHQLSRQRRAAISSQQAAKGGIDVFRVFDCLNWVENMRVAMDAVVEAGKLCEAAICYTGDILDPARAKYDLKYYVGLAKELEKAGAHILGSRTWRGC